MGDGAYQGMVEGYSSDESSTMRSPIFGDYFSYGVFNGVGPREVLDPA